MDAPRSRVIRERLGQVAFGGLYALTLIRMIVYVERSRQLTAALICLMITLGLAVVLTFRRRPAREVDTSVAARSIGTIATFAPFGFLPVTVSPWVPGWVTGLVGLAGILTTLSGLSVLGRSFAMLPAHRGVVQHGIYRWVRHPLYAGYLLAHLAFVLTYPTVHNFLTWMVADGSQVIRLIYEERLLRRDSQYLAYMKSVRWRLVPGVF